MTNEMATKVTPILQQGTEESEIKNKFEVSKIYMTACICLYKFCQIKETFHDFFLFYSKN